MDQREMETVLISVTQIKTNMMNQFD